MKRRLISVFLGIFFLVLFALFSREVKHGFLKTTDFAVTVKVQEKIDTSSRLRLARIVGEVMEGATFFASPLFTSVVVVLLTGVLAVNWKKKSLRLGACIIPVAFALIVAGEVYGKNVVHHPAPPFFMIKHPTSMFPKYYINEEFSYPSGHAARAVFLGFVLYSSLRRRSRVVMLLGVMLYMVTVAISRIYLGHHWFSDIVGGFFLGSGFGFLGVSFL